MIHNLPIFQPWAARIIDVLWTLRCLPCSVDVSLESIVRRITWYWTYIITRFDWKQRDCIAPSCPHYDFLYDLDIYMYKLYLILRRLNYILWMLIAFLQWSCSHMCSLLLTCKMLHVISLLNLLFVTCLMQFLTQESKLKAPIV